jgi:polyisoprenoid-binding protein YceI
MYLRLFFPQVVMRRSSKCPLFVVLMMSVLGLAATQTASGQQFSVHPDKLQPVPVESGTVRVSPANSMVEFMGTHAGENVAPRLGGFTEFSGEIAVEGGTIQSVNAEINVASVWTEFNKLTNHLKAPDFFDIGSFATAKFSSTEVAPGKSPGEVAIKGNLTFHGATQPITLPGKVQIGPEGLTLVSAFKLDRTAFGMKDHTDSVDPLVTVSVVVGQKTEPRSEQDQPSGGQRRRRDASRETPKAPPASGLRVGESVEPWTPVHVSGPDEGTKACPVCNYWNRPAILVFAKDEANTPQLLAQVESLLEQHESDGLKAFCRLGWEPGTAGRIGQRGKVDSHIAVLFGSAYKGKGPRCLQDKPCCSEYGDAVRGLSNCGKFQRSPRRCTGAAAVGPRVTRRFDGINRSRVLAKRSYKKGRGGNPAWGLDEWGIHADWVPGLSPE